MIQASILIADERPNQALCERERENASKVKDENQRYATVLHKMTFGT